MTSLTKLFSQTILAEGKFPKNIHYGPKISVWIEREIEEWIKNISL